MKWPSSDITFPALILFMCPVLNVLYLWVGGIKTMVMDPDGNVDNVQIASVKQEMFSGLIP
jgi:hypothetical protein